MGNSQGAVGRAGSPPAGLGRLVPGKNLNKVEKQTVAVASKSTHIYHIWLGWVGSKEMTMNFSGNARIV